MHWNERALHRGRHGLHYSMSSAQKNSARPHGAAPAAQVDKVRVHASKYARPRATSCAPNVIAQRRRAAAPPPRINVNEPYELAC